MQPRQRRRRRRRLLGGTLALLTGPPAALIAVALVAAGIGTCTSAGGLADAASPAAQAEIPSQWLQIFQQIGGQYRIPWEILAGISKQECNLARDPDPSCTPQPGATNPGKANYAGASGPMQIGIGEWFAVGSTRGAVAAFRPLRFRGPPPEPGVRVPPHRALHGHAGVHLAISPSR